MQSISTLIFVIIATTLSMGLMIPQIIKVHKNKTKDNSSIWMYILYAICNLSWAIYNWLYLSLILNNNVGIDVIVPTIISASLNTYCAIIGIYLTCVKSYYIMKRGDE